MFTRAIRKKFGQFVAPQSEWKKPVRVAVTGATGNIGYATLFRIANGAMLGPDQPIILHLVDLPFAESALQGVKMELDDCAFPLLQEIVTATDQTTGFKDIDFALLVGSKPRGPGMERGDLLKDNGAIFVDTGKALNDNASRDVRVLVVGNPANTNCMIAEHYAPDLPSENFHAMTRLDHDRAISQLSTHLNVPSTSIENLCIWGNHSPTMYPDLRNTTVNGQAIYNTLDSDWLNNDFIPGVQQRGAAIINARGLSSAASAGNAALSHMRDWVTGTDGQWTSFSVKSTGQYGVPEGLIFSYPVTVENGQWNIVEGIDITPEAQQSIDKTTAELLSEREAVQFLLK